MNIEETIQILMKAPYTRRANEIQLIFDSTKSVSLFRKITEETKSKAIHEHCCNAMFAQIYQQGESIVEYGQNGSEFYIILKGIVGVMVPELQEKRKITIGLGIDKIQRRQTLRLEASKLLNNTGIKLQLKKSTTKEYSTLIEESELNSARMQEEENKLKQVISNTIVEPEAIHLQSALEQIDYQTIFEEVSELKPGDSFGEISLIRNIPRTATVVCKSQVCVAVLQKSDFDLICKKVVEEIRNKKIEFLQQISCFRSWAKNSILRLEPYFFPKSYQRHQILFQEDDPVDNIYFVVDGEFKLTRKIPILKQINTPTVTIKKEVQQKLTAQLVIKGKNEIIGYEEILENSKIRKATCICISSSAQVFWISRDNFIYRIQSVETMHILKQKYEWDKSRSKHRLKDAIKLEILMSSNQSKTPKARFQPRTITPQSLINPLIQRKAFKDARLIYYPKIHQNKSISNTRSNSTPKRKHLTKISLPTYKPHQSRKYSPQSPGIGQNPNRESARKRLPPPNFHVSMPKSPKYKNILTLEEYERLNKIYP